MDFLLDALAVLFPVDCAGCGAPDRSVCVACVAGLGPVVATPLPGLSVVSAASYEGTTRELVLAFKESGRTDAARALGRAVSPLLAPASEVALLPPSRAALRRRGYDPVALLVRRAGHRPLQVLRRVRTGAAQKSLDVAGRAQNSAGSLVAIRSLAGRRLVLVDDVMTTGATLLEAARAIRAAGGEVDAAVTLAATPRHFGHSR